MSGHSWKANREMGTSMPYIPCRHISHTQSFVIRMLVNLIFIGKISL